MKTSAVFESRKIAVIGAILSSILGCASSKNVTEGYVLKDLEKNRAKLIRNFDYYEKLKAKRVGVSGYYYILNADGRVAFHPQSAIIGADMSGLGFVELILSRKNGCLACSVEERRMMIFFREIEEGYYLCLSVPESEMEGSFDCIEIMLSD